ncbi:bifunctional adenosylcobinamide kinase/adenosylcobinamide-phosphate guanylyltransferase [Clostridium niameyense]|uniref:Adenosylcobinamide kinase n=1 Tax=Clostridium niameyense TaxID=1622073 RepID=A0A6M0R9Q6_9CLOT|nr:bifunctional adenosylcobinamide kinase/adenosylcobinamide-phosphate guanylyltransferase [Clostridium niameyense]NEZ47005.1 bifunctional adenosylcobinamide kinase/adenosylcobinamide-phosphate guanylyltransferase [Clostridium niameyense]
MGHESKIILITGGARSGKSEFAESLLKDEKEVLYIATANITDDEMKNRIEKHRERRPKAWNTYEGSYNLDKVLYKRSEKYILLDCVTVMITNLMFQENIDYDKISSDKLEDLLNKIKKEFEKLIYSAIENKKQLIMVTNEVGYGVVPAYKLGRIFRDFAGSINKFIAFISDEVYLVTCGIPLKIK